MTTQMTAAKRRPPWCCALRLLSLGAALCAALGLALAGCSLPPRPGDPATRTGAAKVIRPDAAIEVACDFPGALQPELQDPPTLNSSRRIVRLDPPEPVSPTVSVPDENVRRRLCTRMSPEAQGLDSWRDMRPALLASLDYLDRLHRNRGDDALLSTRTPLSLRQLRLAAARLLGLLSRLDAQPELLEQEFRWMELSEQATMTGYYTPLVEASLTPRAGYPYPVYGLPPELEGVKPGKAPEGLSPKQWSRDAIDFAGALAGRGLEIAWARDRVDLFNLHVQGAGVLALPDGTRRRVNYAGKNGLPFTGLGAVFRDLKLIPGQPITRRTIKDYIASHPDQARDLLRRNQSYIFFQLLEGGSMGTMGAALTPRVSLATDPALAPLGAAAVFEARLPAESGSQAPVVGLGLAQDTGGVIKGPRVDFFWGEGPQVEYQAMRTHSPARLYVLLSD